MKRNRTFEQRYLKYVVKSPLLFASYLIIFATVFFWMTNSLQLEVRTSYPAEALEDRILITAENPLSLPDERIYAYMDKNQEVFLFHTASAEYDGEILCLHLKERQEQLRGPVTVELISSNHTLFQAIFLKTGGTP